MILLWDFAIFQIIFGHPGNSSAQYRIECFDYRERNALKASKDERKQGKKSPKAFRYVRVWSIQNPLGRL